MGAGLAIILAAANAYLGLYAGMTVSASIPAAVMALALLRASGGARALEVNVVQTGASAGESLAAGVIFTFPALVIMGYWQVFDYFWVSLIAALGGLLGVLFTIPLRRALVLDAALPYPEGRATAEVVRLGETGGAGALLIAGALGAAYKLAQSGFQLWSAATGHAVVVGNSIFSFGFGLSPALVGVGYIVGLNVATLIFAGGAFAWLIAIPAYGFWVEPAIVGSPMAAAAEIWSAQVRYIGVGAMLVGGLWSLGAMLPALMRTFGVLSAGGFSAASPDTERDIPLSWVLAGIAVLIIPIFLVYRQLVGLMSVSLAMAMMMVVSGFLFSAVAAYMAGIVGSSHNPISGVTIATLLASSLLLLLMLGADDRAAGSAAAILIGAVVCCAAAIAGDNMQDLKAGHLLGATPWKQQVMQGLGVISSVLVMAPILNLLHGAYGFGPPSAEHPNALAAPQATLMAAVVSGVFGGGLPWSMVTVGAGVALLVIAADEWLRRRRGSVRLPVLAVAVGIYLPIELSAPIALGGLLAYAASRGGARPRRDGVLFAAGLITAEAVTGILLATAIVMTGRSDVLALAAAPWGGWPGVLLLAGIGLLLWRAGSPAPE